MEHLDRFTFFPADKCPESTSVPGSRAQHAHDARSHTTEAPGEFIRSHRPTPRLMFEHQSQRSSLDLFHACGTGGNKMMPGAQKERGGVGPLGNAGGSWNSRICLPPIHNKRPNQLRVSGSCKYWQKASPCLKPALLLVPWGLP